MANCTSVSVEEREADCTLEGGAVVPHGDNRMLGCETCGCRNGKLRCTKKRRGCRVMSPSPSPSPFTPCSPLQDPNERTPSPDPMVDSPSFDETATDPCDACRAMPLDPTCGPDGRNHLSRCTAVRCAGIPAVNLQEGPCQSQVRNYWR